MAVERVDDPTTSMYQPQIRQSDHVRFQRRSDRQTGPSELLWSQGPMGPPFFRKKGPKNRTTLDPMVPKNNEIVFLNTEISHLEPKYLHKKDPNMYRPNLKPMVPMGLPILRKTEENLYKLIFQIQSSFWSSWKAHHWKICSYGPAD